MVEPIKTEALGVLEVTLGFGPGEVALFDAANRELRTPSISNRPSSRGARIGAQSNRHKGPFLKTLDEREQFRRQ